VKFKKFIGPFDVIKLEGKQAWVAGEDGVMIQYNVSQLKPYIEPAHAASEDSIFLTSFSEIRSYVENEPLRLNHEKKEPLFSSSDDSPLETVSILASETLEFDDPRARSNLFDDAKKRSSTVSYGAEHGRKFKLIRFLTKLTS
jgi:hypothetical protein